LNNNNDNNKERVNQSYFLNLKKIVHDETMTPKTQKSSPEANFFFCTIWLYRLDNCLEIKGRVWDLQNGRQILKIHKSKGPTFFPPKLALTPPTPPIRRGGWGEGVWYHHSIDALTVQ